MFRETQKQIKILLVEENKGDLVLIRETLLSGRLLNQIDIVPNAEEAMKYLDNVKHHS